MDNEYGTRHNKCDSVNILTFSFVEWLHDYTTFSRPLDRGLGIDAVQMTDTFVNWCVLGHVLPFGLVTLGL